MSAHDDSDFIAWVAGTMQRIRIREARREHAWREKKRREAAFRFARSELSRSVPISQVMARTGLSYEQLRNLQARMRYERRRAA